MFLISMLSLVFERAKVRVNNGFLIVTTKCFSRQSGGHRTTHFQCVTPSGLKLYIFRRKAKKDAAIPGTG
ncbi:MAG: hypothetical protein CL868_14660 [Cytophagaceae bacterium]|nr:hypothetical protein [Cytophagaceae bacterium]